MDQVARREEHEFVPRVHFAGAKWLQFTVNFRDRNNNDGRELCQGYEFSGCY